MNMPAQGGAGYYVWEPEGKAFEVHVNLDLIENLGVEILRGFGAVPKRGAEVGGILLGSIERDGPTIVRIEDFQAVPCGYTRGPSYLLSDEEADVFQRAATDLAPEAGEANYAVGYFRSNTRETFALASEDVELMDACFPGPSSVILLVKPFATRASTAGFFFREDGQFQQNTLLEFPFRRREILGEEPPERRPLMDRRPRGQSSRALAPLARQEEPAAGTAALPPLERPLDRPLDADDAGGFAYATTLPKRTKLGGWMLFPLSFIFLLLGVALGFWAAPGFSGMLGAPARSSTGAPDYSLGLAANKSADSLMVQWNGDSPAVRGADRGVLEIHDAGYAKTVDLDAAQLRGGKLAFRNASTAVTFRLTVYLNSRLSISETLDWQP